MEPVIENLSHRVPYVRRNAVMCVHAIYKHFGDEFLHEIVPKIETLLEAESDLSTRRNAILLLFEADIDAAIKYL